MLLGGLGTRLDPLPQRWGQTEPTFFSWALRIFFLAWRCKLFLEPGSATFFVKPGAAFFLAGRGPEI